jgi:hypothetical protein
MEHAVDVQADSLYEAAVRGLSALRATGWVQHSGLSRNIRIEVREPATVHTLPFSRLESWLYNQSNPRDFANRAKLRELLIRMGTPRAEKARR